MPKAEDIRGVGLLFTRFVDGEPVAPKQSQKLKKRMDMLGDRDIPKLKRLRAQYAKYKNDDMVQAIDRIIEKIEGGL